jgi:hypothetical protein
MTNPAPDRCCDESRENIPWYVNGTLSAPTAAALREHIKGCSDCQADLEIHTEMRASVLGRELTPMIPVLGVALVLALYSGKDTELSNQLFQTATTAGSSEGIDYVLQLRFDERVSESEAGRITAELDGAIRWAVNDNGVYEVHVRLPEASLQVLQEYEEHAEALQGVQSAKFTALQLPIR